MPPRQRHQGALLRVRRGAEGVRIRIRIRFVLYFSNTKLLQAKYLAPTRVTRTQYQVTRRRLSMQPYPRAHNAECIGTTSDGCWLGCWLACWLGCSGVLAGRNGAASPALCGGVAYYAQSWECIFRLSISFDSFECTPTSSATQARGLLTRGDLRSPTVR